MTILIRRRREVTPPPPPKRTRAERVTAFIERYLRAPDGDHAGEPFVVEPFQAFWIKRIYDNPYGTRTAIWSAGKKNGKTSLCAALMLAHLVGPEAKLNRRQASAAMSKEQSAILFELAAKMVQMSPKLKHEVRVNLSLKQMYGLAMNTEYRALARDARGQRTQGGSYSVIWLDEPGQIVGTTDPFVDALLTSQGAFSDAMTFLFSTQAASDADWFSTVIDNQRAAPDKHVVMDVFEAPMDCELDDQVAWKMANPALDIFRSRADLEKQAKTAMELPSSEAGFRNLCLNQRVSTNAPFCSHSVWDANGDDPGEMKGKKVWAGLDLANVSDLAALVAVAEDGGVYCAAWIPEVGLAEKSRVDKTPYDVWVREGYLMASPGRAIEFEYIAKYLRGFFDNCDVQALGFDRHLFNHLRPWLVKAGFTEDELKKFIPYGQGFKDMTPAVRELEVRLLNRALKHGNHPVLKNAMYSVTVVGDSGARKFDKRDRTRRIDPAVALLCAIGVMPTVTEVEVTGPCIYLPRHLREQLNKETGQ